MNRWIWSVALAAAVGGCASLDISGPDRSALEFDARAVPPGEWREQPQVQAEGGVGRIEVRAQLSAPDPCRTLSAAVEGSGAERTLQVTIRRQGEVCVTAIGNFEYQAILRDLRPGDYRLRVVHTYPGTGFPTTTVLDQQVRVR